VARRTIPTLTKVVQVFVKAVCCAAAVFVVLAALGIWLQKVRRGPE